MREVITIGFGSSGVSIGETFWKDLHDETGISYEGEKKSDHPVHD